MGILDLIRHPLIFTGITVPEFIRWYFWQQPRKILTLYFEYVRAFIEIFSFLFLVRTLISPWKQISDPYPKKGFDMGKIAQAMTLNMVSRTIGFMFRMFTLTFGLVSVIFLTALFGVFYLSWLSFPIIFWVGLGYVFSPIL